MKISREQLLHQLQSVMPGIHLKETVVQSSCFCFQGRKLMSFNDELSCIRSTDIDFEGAVKAPTFLSILEKLTEEEIDLEPNSNRSELIIRGNKGKKIGIPMEAEIELPIDKVEPVDKKWKRLPEGWIEAAELAHQCCSNDESMFKLTCVHLHPDYIEGCDDEQMCRTPLETGISASTLVRHSSMKHIVSLGMTKFTETDSWLHFKNPDGLILSCRRHMEEYHSLDSFLEVEGTKVTLPKGLKEATDNAEIFSKENPENQKVRITLSPGKIIIKGTGNLGWYFEPKKIKYSGQKLKFLIAPKLLIQLIENHNEATINAKRLKIDGGTYQFVTALEETHSQGSNGEADA